jgi:hydrogenase/urease accessory protein HupE
MGTLTGSEPAFPVAACSFLILGGLVSADLRLPLPTITALVALLGLVHGMLNGVALRSGPGVSGLLGIAAALFVIVALVAAATVALRPRWTRIAVRVAGSWVVAVGMLMLGWTLAAQG